MLAQLLPHALSGLAGLRFPPGVQLEACALAQRWCSSTPSSGSSADGGQQGQQGQQGHEGHEEQEEQAPLPHAAAHGEGGSRADQQGLRQQGGGSAGGRPSAMRGEGGGQRRGGGEQPTAGAGVGRDGALPQAARRLMDAFNAPAAQSISPPPLPGTAAAAVAAAQQRSGVGRPQRPRTREQVAPASPAEEEVPPADAFQVRVCCGVCTGMCM